MKPVVILFNGFGSSKIFWQYGYNGTKNLIKLNFLNKLKNLGDVYTFNSNFFNINYYSIPDNVKDKKIWNEIYKKYKPHTKNIQFDLEDLDYKNICEKVYTDVINKYGDNRKYILVGHSYGSCLALLFSKLYKKDCLLVAVIDNPPYLLDFYKKYDSGKNKKTVDKYFSNNNDLHMILDKIKTNGDNQVNVNKEIDKVYKLIEYRSSYDRIKYFNNKLPVPTLFFRAFHSQPKTKFEKEWNQFSVLEKENLIKNNNSNMFKYIVMLDAEHFIWKNPIYSDTIISEITQLITNINNIYHNKYIKYKTKYITTKGGNNNVIFITGKAASGKSNVARKFEQDGYFLVSLDEIIRHELASEMTHDVQTEFNGDYTYLYRLYRNDDDTPIISKARNIFIKIIKDSIAKNKKVVVEGSLWNNDSIRKIFGKDDEFTFYFVKPKNEEIYLERLKLRFMEDPNNYGRLGFLWKNDADGKALADYHKNGITGELINNLINTVGKKEYGRVDEWINRYKDEFLKMKIFIN